jgi:hypothetical protein
MFNEQGFDCYALGRKLKYDGKLANAFHQPLRVRAESCNVQIFRSTDPSKLGNRNLNVSTEEEFLELRQIASQSGSHSPTGIALQMMKTSLANMLRLLQAACSFHNQHFLVGVAINL